MHAERGDGRLSVRRLSVADLSSKVPWLTGSPINTSRQDCRKMRSRAPVFEPGVVVNASDGAARNGGTAMGRQSSCGCVRYIAGSRSVVACCGRDLGDGTKKYAEYAGLLECMQHALEHPAPNLVFQSDSL